MAKRKIKRARPSKKAAAEARLQSLLAERATLEALVTNPVQLAAAARGLLANFDEAKALGNLRGQIAKIDAEVPKLRKLLGSRAIIPDPAGPAPWPLPFPPPTPWPPFPWKPTPWPPIPEWAIVELLKRYKPKVTPCQGTSGVTPVTETTDVEFFPPSFPETVSYSGFDAIQQPGFFGISFADMFIDTTNIVFPVLDKFHVMRALAFNFPAVDCDGTFNCDVNYQLALTPEVGATPGMVRVLLRGRLYANPVPNYTDVVFPQFEAWEGRGASHDEFTPGPDFWIFDERFRPKTVDVVKGDAPALYVAVTVYMHSVAGRSSFEQNGNAPIGHVIFIGEGIPYTFTPA